jgi:GT2 family glycosyltransferase/glycosyltransferase involved in cell wall biosynthesis/predicted  nucleic acid-binding Zn-ribbon protein
MNDTQRGAIFDETYYRTGCGLPYFRNDHWLNFFGGIAGQIIRSLQPRRVFDAGCAMGMLVESFWDRGVEAHGVDLSPYAISQVRPDMRPYCRVGSLVEPVAEKYDLVTCIEVVEHMPEDEALAAVANVTDAADRILFSSTPSDFTEPTHINVHPTIYWLKQFAALGFWPDLLFDAGFVAPHAILFSRRSPGAYADAELLGAFSELLRLRCALVEREQRIGSLNAEREQWREELAAVKGRLSKEQAELAKVESAYQEACGRFAASDAELAHARELLGAARSRLATSDIDLARARDAMAAADIARQDLVRQAAELNAGLHSIASARDALNGQLEAAQAQVAALEAERSALFAASRELEQETTYLRRTLAGVVTSPGWRAILAYRRWLWTAYSTSRIIRRWYEPVARSFVRKLSVAAPEGVVEAQKPEALPPEPAGAGAPDISYERWIAASEPGAAELAFQGVMAAQLFYRPKISVVLPVYKVSLDVLRETVASVRGQTYDHWELAITHGDPEDAAARAFLENAARDDSRIKVDLLEANEGISGNSNRALALCSGEFVTLLDHDDTLAPFALFEVARLLNEKPDLDFIYSDKDQLSEDGQRVEPLFKPQWSPETMASANYLTHLCIVRAAELRAIGGWRSETDGAQDWDLFLRVCGRSRRIAHIPKVLYHWRRVASSVSMRGLDAKPYAAAAQLRAVQEHLDRAGVQAEVGFTSSGLMRLAWRGKRPSVSVVALAALDDPTLRDRLRKMTGGTVETRIVKAGGNVAERLNNAARECSGEVVIFVDSAVTPANDEWIDELAYPLRDPAVGAVGAKLFDRQSSAIRHAGIVFGADGVLQYPLAGENDYTWSVFGGANWYRNWLAVSGACFAVRRDAFLKAGGFARQPNYPRLDVDLCLNLTVAQGLRILYNPFARMWQDGPSLLERWTGGDRTSGAEYFRREFPEGDPYFNPNIACSSGAISLRIQRDASTAQDHNFAGEARALVRLFDYTPDEVEASRRSSAAKHVRAARRFTWFIPQFSNPFYGGIHTILRFADYFQRAHGVRSDFAVLGHRPPERTAALIASAFPQLAETAKISVIGDYGGLDQLGESDAALATLWTTAYYLLRFNRTGRKFYFMQDYEPLFYPAGSTAALVEATYRFGFHGICNTAPLRDLYAAHGGEAEFFDPSIDPAVFFEPRRAREGEPYVLFCYARPGHSRNCFELLAQALRKLKRRMGARVTIVTAGEAWSPARFDLDGVVHNLGLLDYRSTGAVYRAAHAGVTMMMTCHPSYLPLELMACRSLAISNRSEYTGWLLQDRENCLLADSSPGAMAEVLEEGLRDEALRTRLTRNAAEMIARKYQDWDGQAEKVFQYIAGML